jgi:hypothetical protein
MSLPAGSVVSEADLQECNIEALVESGHLVLVANKPAKTATVQQEENN